jgi:hypothetical protein
VRPAHTFYMLSVLVFL